MKIAVFTDSYKPQINGVVTHIEETTRIFAKKGHEVVIFAPGKSKSFVKTLNDGRKVFFTSSIPFTPYKEYRVSKPKIKRIYDFFKKNDFDIIHIHSPFTLGMIGILMGKIFNLPIVGTYHTLWPEFFPHLTKGKFKSVMRKVGEYPTKKFTQFVYSKLDVIIAPSNETKKFLESYELENIMVVPNGIVIKRYQNVSSRAKSVIAKKYKIPKDKKILLYVGRISLEKKIDVLLDAYSYVERNEDSMLLIVGRGPILKNLKEYAKSKGIKTVKFLGYIPDDELPAIYNLADVFVSASDSETQGIVFLEAMAAGLPIVAVNKGGAKDVVKDRKNGFLAVPNDPIDFAIKMIKLLNNKDLYESFRKESLRMCKKFDVEETSKKLLSIYRDLLKKKKRKNSSKILNVLKTLYKRLTYRF
ncbi:MAG: glycosyltransferase [Candidatus Aenigmarchaeota archaeon]|nr:glycosyltransferase [Candidatus Aenigmarchaeota archaeon]